MEGCRLATEEDVRRVAELFRMGADELEPTRGGAVWRAREARAEPAEESLLADLARADGRLLAGTIDGVVVGYAWARLEKLSDGSILGVIDEIFVEPEARGVGVGEAMITDLIAWCEEAGCRGIDSMALPGHRDTKNFFEQSGFTARKLVMHHRLDRDGDDEGAGG